MCVVQKGWRLELSWAISLPYQATFRAFGVSLGVFLLLIGCRENLQLLMVPSLFEDILNLLCSVGPNTCSSKGLAVRGHRGWQQSLKLTTHIATDNLKAPQA